MLIDEIEVQGASLSYRCLSLQVEDITATFETLMTNGDRFNPETGVNGFHDCDCDKGIIRGFYTIFKTFEVEHYVDLMTTKENFVRLEHCEFIITPERVYVFGQSAPAKLLEGAISAATGCHVERVEFDLTCMEKVQNRLTIMETIVVENSKQNPIRRARLTGHMEDYEAIPVVEAGNHEINSMKGTVETPLGAMKLTVDKKGKITLGVKKGMIVNVDNLNFIFDLITAEEAPVIKALVPGASENAPF